MQLSGEPHKPAALLPGIERGDYVVLLAGMDYFETRKVSCSCRELNHYPVRSLDITKTEICQLIFQVIHGVKNLNDMIGM